MDFLLSILGACSDVQKAGKPPIIHDDDASDMQLNAFEFRNYRTSLETAQHRLLERVVNQWCAMLVKGKTLKINDFEEKLFLDKDMMNLEYSGELYPLRAITRMEMFKDTDDMMMEVPWGLDVTFSFMKDPSSNCEVLAKDDEEEEEDDDEKQPFAKVAATQRFNVEDSGIPIVFSLVDLKIYQKMFSTSRHVYLEFFVRYPRQDKFLYAKSGTTHIPQAVLATEDGKKKKKAPGEEDDKDQKKADEDKKDEVLCTMKFDMKNVKLKIPRVPHTIFGRLMAKDDYFPTAVGTFEFDLKKSYLQDRREIDPAELEELRRQQKKKAAKRDKSVVDGMRTDPEMLAIPVTSTWKSHDDQMKHLKIGSLGLRLIGYVLDIEKKNKKEKDSDDEEEDGEENEDDEDVNDDGEEGEESDEEEGGQAEGSGSALEEADGWGSEDE